MEVFTVEEFQEDFDNLLERVEGGESFVITSEGKEVVIMPADDDLIRIHTDHEEGS